MDNMNITNQPIIIAGMHRSGTSLLSKVLIDMNINMGHYLDVNNESKFFQRLNRWILSCIGSSWDAPKTLVDINSEDLKIIENKLLKSLQSKTTSSIYFGLRKSIFNHSFSNIEYNWGWKDPSNTFTLPVWLNIFKKAKVIYVLRHPLDVSNSLLKRNNFLKRKDHNNSFPNLFSKYLSILSISKGGVSCSFNINNIDDCLSLYNNYYNEIIKLSKTYNILFIKYEDLILDTSKSISQLSEFLEKDFNKELLIQVNKYINKERVYAFKNSSFKYSKELLKNNIYNEN